MSMENVRIARIEDDTSINSIGSLYRYTNSSEWHINLGLYPYQKTSSLTLSQAPILSRRRVLNPTEFSGPAGYEKRFVCEDTSSWRTCIIADCSLINENKHTKIEANQNCFQFTIKSGLNVYLPQFELARVLFLHDAYLARSAIGSASLIAEFDVGVDTTSDSATVKVMRSSGYPLHLLDNAAARSVLSWILLDPSAKSSYESINRYQYESATEKNGCRQWDFQFDPPDLKNIKLTVRGKYDADSDSIFVYEITELQNLKHQVPTTVEFTHHSFKEYVRGEGKKGCGVSGRPPGHTVHDDETPNSDTKHVMLQAPYVNIEFEDPFETKKVCNKKQSGSYGRKDDEIGNEASQNVSTEEGTVAGNLPGADWNSFDEESDDASLYANKFKRFMQMLVQLQDNHDCSIIAKSLHKLPEVYRCNGHLLKNNDEPRCIAIVEVTSSGRQFIMLEVDTSDAAKSLSTKLLNINSSCKLDLELERLKYALVKSSLTWPNDILSKMCGKDGHKGIPHPKSKNSDKGGLDEKCIENWASRVATYFDFL